MARPSADEQLIDAIYRGAVDTDAFREALSGLAARYRCRGGVLVLFDQQAPAAQLLLNVGACEGEAFHKYQEFAAIDPAPAAFAKLAPGTVSTSSRMFSPDELENGVFVNEYYYPMGFQETLGGAIFAERSRFALLGLMRGDERPAFEEQEVASLERLVPHLIRAMQLRRAFVGLEAKSAGLQSVIDRLEAAVVLLDQAGTAFFVNRAADAIVNRADGISLDRIGRPFVSDSAARRRLEDLIVATCRGGPGGVMAVPRKESTNHYALLVAPASSAVTDGLGVPSARVGAIILIHDPVSRPQGVVEVLQSALGLRPAAARLVAALVADDDLQTYADREGITIHTARFHLHSALARTHARTQAELVRMVVRLLRDLALRDA